MLLFVLLSPSFFRLFSLLVASLGVTSLWVPPLILDSLLPWVSPSPLLLLFLSLPLDEVLPTSSLPFLTPESGGGDRVTHGRPEIWREEGTWGSSEKERERERGEEEGEGEGEGEEEVLVKRGEEVGVE